MGVGGCRYLTCANMNTYLGIVSAYMWFDARSLDPQDRGHQQMMENTTLAPTLGEPHRY